MGNGGVNWDVDYRKMLRIFPEYLRLGNSLKNEDVVQTEKSPSCYETDSTLGISPMVLCAYAVAWVLKKQKYFSSWRQTIQDEYPI